MSFYFEGVHFAFAAKTKRKEIYSFRKHHTACVLSKKKKKRFRARFMYVHFAFHFYFKKNGNRRADRIYFLFTLRFSAFLSTRRQGRIDIAERIELN